MENLHSILCSVLGVSPDSDPILEVKRLKEIESSYRQIERLVSKGSRESGPKTQVGRKDRSPPRGT